MNSNMSDYGVSKRSSTRQRKSTLTQQQKNQKRQRATPHQLNVLKSEFEINQTPNAKTREEIGRRIDMTERSVQIWFQNNRAKNKILAKKHGNGFPSNVQFSMGGPYSYNRAILGQLQNGLHPMAATFPPTFVGNSMAAFPGSHMGHMTTPAGTTPIAVATMGNGAPIDTHGAFNAAASFSQNVHLSCISLEIGKWRRVYTAGGVTSDLIILYSPIESAISYTMYANGTGFRIKYYLKSVKSLELTPRSDNPNMGDIIINLFQPPIFSTQSPKMPGWVPCEDFSEESQATTNMVHKLEGPLAQLATQLSRISMHEPGKVVGVKSPLAFGMNPLNPVMVGQFGQPQVMMAAAAAAMGSGVNAAGRPTGMMAGTMSEATSPVSSASRLADNIAFGISMSKSRSKSLPSLLLDESIEDFRNMLETHVEDDGDCSQNFDEQIYDTALTDEASTTSFFINEDIVVPEITLSLSSATSTDDSLVETKLQNLNETFTQTATPVSETAADSIQNNGVSAEDVAAALIATNGMLHDGLLVAPAAAISHASSAVVSPLMQLKPMGSMSHGNYELASGVDPTLGGSHALYEEASGMGLEAHTGNGDDDDTNGSISTTSNNSSVGSISSVSSISSTESSLGLTTGESDEKLLMATSANLLDIDGVLGGTSVGDGSSFSGDFDKVLENFGGDGSLFSLIQV
ncbi:uncharacterized protein SAPINGB_P005247 [Magnusiomyces paraingens]|uniref:Homeobox domain-containing protein n=1 Tax=Magnusiomyces paraingens TaxID=2606893 RepID=A0A5E8C1C9_9ASCO|nr:uncharacterized protein SAPINGB_P005247 [Saprochaete ingens]VVT56750.1 unnamed protein product [Saprochaete ingens]